MHPKPRLWIAIGGLSVTASVVECDLLNTPEPTPTGGFLSAARVTLETVIATDDFPVGMVFLPDGALLYAEKNTGRVRAVTPDGVLQERPFADFAVANLGDAGLIGLALDPDFASNGFVYAALTANAASADNALPRTDLRIVRIRANGLAAAPGSETTIAVVPGDPAPGHEGGNVHCGPDRRLYLTIGDRHLNGFPNDAAQDPAADAGRFMRFNRDGTVPADNPFGSDNPTFAIGMRNSFDFTFDPQSGLLFATENGPIRDDELNIVEAGMNYGWPRVSGATDLPEEAAFAASAPDYREPVILLGRAPTGIAFNMHDAYGADLRGDLFIAEYVAGRVVRLRLSDDRRTVVETEVFAEGISGGINDLEFSPDGLIYLSTSEAILRLVP